VFPRHVEDDLACRFNLDEGDALLYELYFHFVSFLLLIFGGFGLNPLKE
jgi:hypothetical protein